LAVQKQSISVALVDDHLMFREAMRHLLREQGFDLVAEAGDAHTSFPLIDAARPDVVLLDLRLPGMDGVSAARELSQRTPSSKVMILSAWSRQHDVDEAWAAGAHGYVSKTQDADGLRAAIHAVVAGERYLSPGLQPSPKEHEGPIHILSPREREVFVLIRQGLSDKEIAARLRRSIHTIRVQVRSITRKRGTKRRGESVA
jgi:DNA-binding NarL/FixJ family response regulator